MEQVYNDKVEEEMKLGNRLFAQGKYEEAIAAYEQRAKQGDSACQTRLGKLLLWGKVMQKDEAQAYYWFCKAAEQGDEIAKMWKGHCMTYGLGTPQNLKDGPILLIDALNYNYPGVGSSQAMAQRSQFDWDEDMMQLFWDLGEACETGRGLIKRQHLAGYYYSMVAEGGWEPQCGPAAVQMSCCAS